MKNLQNSSSSESRLMKSLLKSQNVMATLMTMLLVLMLSTVSYAAPVAGVAQRAEVEGREITFDIFVENLGDEELTGVSLTNDLDAVFGAGTYSFSSAPAFVGGSGTLTLNAGYDGSVNTEMISSGGVALGTTVQIRFTVALSSFTDQGMGLGIYAAQAAVSANGGVTSDLSDSGTDPDFSGDGDPRGAGEDDATIFSLVDNPVIGVAHDVSLSGNRVTFDYYLEAYGNALLSGISLPHDLDALFGVANYTLVGGVTLVDDPGGITVNTNFDGSAQTQLISSGSLTVGETAQLRIVVDITDVIDGGDGLGVYSSQVLVEAFSARGKKSSDLSDAGIKPDSNLNGQPYQEGEDDPSPFVIGEEPAVGVAVNATVSGSTVTLDYYLENLGNVGLSSVSLISDLDAVFGVSNYYISAPVSFVTSSGSLGLNSAFNGRGTNDILDSSSTLSVGESAQLRVVVKVLNLADLGRGSGVYQVQSTVEAAARSGATTRDLSDDGTDPDSNGNSDANEVGENDKTEFVVSVNAALGMAKTYRVESAGALSKVVLTYRVENIGNVPLSLVNVNEDLNSLYGAGNYFNTLRPTHLSGKVLTYNSGFNGNTNMVLVSTGSLDVGEYAIFKTESMLITKADVGFGVGVYSSQNTVTAQDPDLNTVTDISDSGTVVDLNGNGIANEVSENRPTTIDTNSFVGLALNATVVNDVVTFDITVENFGSAAVTAVKVEQSLDNLLGSGNYVITSPPSWTTAPAGVTLKAGYDGSNITDLIEEGSVLAAGSMGRISLSVQITKVANMSGLGVGQYEASLNVAALGASGQLLADVSTAGLDPDVGVNPVIAENSNPQDNSEVTAFSVVQDAQVGAGMVATVTGNQVVVDLFLENFGASVANSLSVTQDLDAVFGSGNYTLVSSPSLVDDPGSLVLNAGYDGAGDNDLLSTGSSLVGGETAQIQFIVDVTQVVDRGLYEIQGTISGVSPAGVQFSDLSDNSFDPDNDGNGDPTDKGQADPPIDGNDDVTRFLIGNSALGVAHMARVSGAEVTMDIVIENLGTTDIEVSSINDSLLAIFGFGNVTVSAAPTLVEGPDEFPINASYDGIFSTALSFGGTLAAGERVVIRYGLTITTIQNGGVYSHQLTIIGTDPIGTMVSDLSDEGLLIDVDGDGDASGAGEDDTTAIRIGEEAVIGVALNSTVSNNLATFDFHIENLGNVGLSSVALVQNLDDVFGAGNYTVDQAPSFIGPALGLLVDPAYDGSSNSNLFTAASSLAVGGSAQVRLVVELTNETDQGYGSGEYRAQGYVQGTGPQGSFAADFSDFGTDPDPNGNANPADIGETDAAVISFTNIALGSALQAEVLGNQVTLTYRLENLTNTTEALTNVLLPVDLDSVFGAGNYRLVSAPRLKGEQRGVTVNELFDGSSDTGIISASNLPANNFAEVELVIEVLTLIDGGSGLGLYSHQVTASALSSGGILNDLSDNGSDSDSNGNSQTGDLGEDDATEFQIVEDPTTGVALTTAVSGRRVTFDYYIESYANITVSEISLTADLDSVFGAGNYNIASAPTLIVDPGTLLVNRRFDGSADTQFFENSSTLEKGATAQLRMVVDVVTVSDLGMGLGLYSTQSVLIVESPNGTASNDLSDAGVDPDTNGNADPAEVGENDANNIALEGAIGDFVWNDLDGDGVQDGGEPGLSGVTVYFDANGNGMLDGGEDSKVTDGSGAYRFDNLAANTYTLRVDTTTVPSGFQRTAGGASHVEVLFAGEQNTTVDFGFQQQNATIGDFVWNDLNGNGVQEGGEAGLAGVRVYLDLNANGLLDGGEPQATTSTGGAYGFTGLARGVYAVRIDGTTVPNGFEMTGGVEPLSVTLVAGENDQTADFGFQQQDATIGDFVWDDLNGNGVQEAGEPGLAGVSVYLDLNANGSLDGGEPTKLTSGSGAFDFTNLPIGSYKVRIDSATLPLGFVQTGGSAEVNVVLAAGEDFNDADFGFQRQVDLVLSMTETSNSVLAGSSASNLTYQLTVTNNGPALATNIIINDVETLPSGVSVVSANVSQGSRVGSKWSLGSLAPSASATLTLVMTVGPSAPEGTSVVGLSASIGGLDQVLVNTTNDTASEATDVRRSVDVVVSMTESLDPLVAGNGDLVYLVTVRNNGVSDASGVSLSNTQVLPTGVTVSRTVASSGTSFSSPTWTVGDMAAGSQATLTVTVSAAESVATGTDVVTNLATLLTVNESQTSTANDSAVHLTSVARDVDIVVTVDESAATVIAGSSANNLVYTVTAQNRGPSSATGLVLSNLLRLPAGVTVDSVLAGVGSWSGTTWTLGNLASGASAQLVVTLTVDSSAEIGTNVVNCTAAVSSVNESRLNTGDDSASESSSIDRVVDVQLSTVESIATVVAGSEVGNLIYTVTARNAGPSDATGVSLSNVLTLPANVAVESILVSRGNFSGTTWNLGTVPSDTSETLTVTITVASSAVSATDAIVNVAMLTNVVENQSSTANDESTVRTHITREVDIAVSVVESTESVIAGSGVGNLVYTVTATNKGPSDATGVELTNSLVLPAGVTVESVIASAGGSFTTPTWTIGDLMNGASASLTVALTADASTPEGVDTISNETILNRVNEAVINTSDDSAIEATSAIASVDIDVVATTLTTPLVAGGRALEVFELTVTNNGPSIATNLQLSTQAVLPVGVSLDQFSLTGVASTFIANSGVWTIPALPMNSSATVTLTLIADSSVLAGEGIVSLSVTGATAVQTITTLPVNYQVSTNASVISVAETVLGIRSALAVNPQTGMIEGTIQITNNNDASIPAMRVYVTNLPAGVTVMNASGTAEWNGVAATPYFLVNTETSGSGGVQSISADYFKADREIDFTPNYEIELLDQVEPDPVVRLGAPVALSRDGLSLFDGGVLVEWVSRPGVEYVVQYSDDLKKWTSVVPTVTASANATQWVDSGLPLTASPPGVQRFYRVYEVDNRD